MPPPSQNSDLLDQVQPGDEIEVWWPHDAQYYSGVVGARLPSGRHRIFYNDGEIEDLTLATEQWRIIGAAADRILSSDSPPSLDPSSIQPQPHQPSSQPHHANTQTTNESQPLPPSTSNTPSTGKKRGRPRGKKSDTAKTTKPNPKRASQSSSSSTTHDKQTPNEPQPAKPQPPAKPPTSTKTKATAVKKRQRTSATPAQNAKPPPAKPAVATGEAPSLDADHGLIDAAPLSSTFSKHPSSSPAASTIPATVPAPAPAPAKAIAIAIAPAPAPTTFPLSSPNHTRTDDPHKKSGVISKTSHTPTWIAPVPLVVKQGTIKGPGTPVSVPARNAVPLHETPAKKNATSSPRATPVKASPKPRPGSVSSQAKTTKRLAVIQKAPGANGRTSQSDSKKVGTSTSAQRKAASTPAAATSQVQHQKPVQKDGVASKASTVASTADSRSHNSKEVIQNTAPPLNQSTLQGTTKPLAMKSAAEVASGTKQQKTFVLAANGTVREKSPQAAPRVATPGRERQESGSQAKQIKPKPVTRESPKSAVSPNSPTGAVQSKMALTRIMSGHKEDKKASITCADGGPSDSPSVNSKRHDATKQGTSALKRRDSGSQKGQKGASKSKGAKVPKPLAVKKIISKPVKATPPKRFVTTPLHNAEGSGTSANPRDGSDIIADVTVPRKSKSGITSPLPRSPLHLRPSLYSPGKPASKTGDVGSMAKTGPNLKMVTINQAGSETAPSADTHAQEKGEHFGSKLAPFQPTRRRFKSLSGGVASKGQHQTTTNLHRKTTQQELPHHLVLSDKESSEKERQRRSSEPQTLNTQHEHIASVPDETKNRNSDDASRRASQPSPMPSSKGPQAPQVSAPSTGLDTVSVTKALHGSLPKQGTVQPRPQQPSSGSNSKVDKTASKQASTVDTPASNSFNRMEIDANARTGVKRAASASLNEAKRRRPNTPKSTAPNAAVSKSDTKTAQRGTGINVTSDGGLDTQQKTKSLASTVDAASVAVSKAKSPEPLVPDDKGTFTASFAAPQRVDTTDGSGNDIQARSSGSGSVPLSNPVRAQEGKKDQPSMNLLDAPKTSGVSKLKEAQQSQVKENQEVARESQPPAANPPKSFARVRQRLSAGPGRSNNSSRGIINIPKDASEMSATSAIDAIKQAVREANVESLQPQLAPVVTRIEKCFADSDRKIRSLQGRLDRSTKTLESLQKQVQDIRKTLACVPSISEVQSILESQALEMKRAAMMAMESAVTELKKDMQEYLSRELKTGLENVAGLVQKDSIMVISKAVDNAMTSELLQDLPRAPELNRTRGQQDSTPERNVGIENEANMRRTVPGSAEVSSDHNRENREGNAGAPRPTSTPRSVGTGVGASLRESKRDSPSGDVMKETTRSPSRDPKAGAGDPGLPSQNTPEHMNGPNLRQLPASSSNGPATNGFETSRRRPGANCNERSGAMQEGPSMSQGEVDKIAPRQNANSQRALPLSNGVHPDSSKRPDQGSRGTSASGERRSNVESNGLRDVAQTSAVPSGSHSLAPPARKENYGYVSNRMKVLLARSAIEWFLKGGCRDFAPQNERTSPVSDKWVRDSVRRSLSGILVRLQPEEDFKDAMTTLAHSVGCYIQTDWLLKGPTIGNIIIARKNYEEWDPQLFDFEWESEKRVLAMLSDELLRSEKILMTAGEILEDPLRTAIRCVEHASRRLSS